MAEEASQKKHEDERNQSQEASQDAEENESMEEILETIRDVITGSEEENAEDILDLTQEVSTDAVNTNQAKTQANDVLNAIDHALKPGELSEASSEEKAQEKSTQESSPKADQDGVKPEVKQAEPEKQRAPQEKNEEETSQPSAEVKSAKPEHAEEKSSQDAASVVIKSLLSEGAMQESVQAMQDLVDTVPKPSSGIAFRSGMTMEQLVVEALKPELSRWLDENLPQIVKQLVEKEIQKIVPKNDL